MFFLLFGLWIIFNGAVTVEIVILGFVLSLAVFLFMCKFMDYSISKEKALFQRIRKFAAYIVLLVKQVIQANLEVMALILSDREVVEPVIINFKIKLKDDVEKMLLANSITLTPGTITVSIEEDELVVHCLDERLAEGLEDSEFARKLKEME